MITIIIIVIRCLANNNNNNNNNKRPLNTNLNTHWTLKSQNKFVADDIPKLILLFRENKPWHFMWSSAQQTIDMTCQALFSPKKNQNVVCCALDLYKNYLQNSQLFRKAELLNGSITCFPFKTPRKHASENVVCLYRLLNSLANFSNLFLHTGKQCGPRSDCS